MDNPRDGWRTTITQWSTTMAQLIKSACCAVCLFALEPLASAADEPEPVPLVSAKQEYWARFDGEDWSAAIRAAQALVEQARAEGNAVPLAEALTMLGNAQLRSADLSGAEASFKEALDLVEGSEGRASAHTLSPLRGLGFTLAAANRHAEAVPYLDRALLISHRTFGLFHEDQQSILKQLANSLTLTGQPLVAERHVKYLMQVGERNYGEDDPRIVPLMCQVGDWHAEVGMFDVARRHYRDAIRLVEDKLGKKNVAVVLPLRQLAASYVKAFEFYAKGYIDPYTARTLEASPTLPRKGNPRYIDGEGQRALQRALEIVQAQPEPPRDLLVQVLVDLGDWHQFRQDTKKAFTYYREAAQAYAQLAADDKKAMPDPFAFPVRVYFPVPSVIARGNRMLPDQSEDAFVEFEFTVTADGTVENPTVTDSNTHQRHITEILNAMREARFRPKFVDGEPVETAAMNLREVYRVKKLPRGAEEPS